MYINILLADMSDNSIIEEVVATDHCQWWTT